MKSLSFAVLVLGALLLATGSGSNARADESDPEPTDESVQTESAQEAEPASSPAPAAGQFRRLRRQIAPVPRRDAQAKTGEDSREERRALSEKLLESLENAKKAVEGAAYHTRDAGAAKQASQLLDGAANQLIARNKNTTCPSLTITTIWTPYADADPRQLHCTLPKTELNNTGRCYIPSKPYPCEPNKFGGFFCSYSMDDYQTAAICAKECWTHDYPMEMSCTVLHTAAGEQIGWLPYREFNEQCRNDLPRVADLELRRQRTKRCYEEEWVRHEGGKEVAAPTPPPLTYEQRVAAAEDDHRRLNYYQVDDFLAGRTGDAATPPPSHTEWAILRAGWTPKQYALTDPSLQGSVGGRDFGSMRDRSPEEISAEKWRRMALVGP